MTNVKDKKSLLSESEAAARIGYSVFSLREFRKRGEIDHFLFGRTVRYSPSQIEAFKRKHLRERAI